MTNDKPTEKNFFEGVDKTRASEMVWKIISSYVFGDAVLRQLAYDYEQMFDEQIHLNLQIVAKVKSEVTDVDITPPTDPLAESASYIGNTE